MGNETDTAGLIPRKRVYYKGEVAADIDGRCRVFFYAPDGTKENGLDIKALDHLYEAIVAVRRFLVDVHHGRKELPK